MGNWTTVHISGTCDQKDLPALKAAINDDDWENFDCLTNSGGLCGLGDWPGETISAVGNLAERDYDAESVAGHLKELIKVAPSLNIVVHVGGDYESTDCVATVKCENGEVTICEPEIKTIPSIPQGQIDGNLLKALMGR